MFQCCFYSEHTVYPTAVNKTLQSYFVLHVRESWCSRELGLSHCKYCFSVHADERERVKKERQTEKKSTCDPLKYPWRQKTQYSHVIRGQFVPTLTFCLGYDQWWLAKCTGENAAAELESWRRTVCVDCWLWGEPVVPSISYSWAKWCTM